MGEGREEGEGREGKGGWRAGGWEGVEGRGRGGGSKFYQGTELIQCGIDPNEGEALSRGSGEGRADGREGVGERGGREGGRGGGAGQGRGKFYRGGQN